MAKFTDKTLLVRLNISQWTARKLDRQATRDVTIQNQASAGAARVNKSLLYNSMALQRIKKLSDEVRREFIARCLPWGEDGQHIIKAEAFIPFTQYFHEKREAWLSSVTDFVSQYPVLREEAREALGFLYKAEDYPEPDQIAGKFRMEFKFSPLPDVTDWRVELGDEDRERLRQQIEDDVKACSQQAMQDAWRRLYDVVSKTHERLSDPKNVFRDSLVDNAKECCTILTALNISDDANLEGLRRELEGAISKTTPTLLRDNEAHRADVADKMKDIMGKMGAFYGAN